jgi:hypothetical protein
VSLSDVFPTLRADRATTRESLALAAAAPFATSACEDGGARLRLDEGLPPMTLDEHGALAMIRAEADSTGEARVLRYAVDWNGADATTPEFDAAMTIIPDADVLAPAMTRVPGDCRDVGHERCHPHPPRRPRHELQSQPRSLTRVSPAPPPDDEGLSPFPLDGDWWTALAGENGRLVENSGLTRFGSVQALTG